ncbi:MAG: nucleotide-binding protein [Promicromonosporaceae bacterium]|nr:nucleotide-binding protein [Promicromonosporaceae bacterium]
MLESCDFAILIHTGEDETLTGSVQGRMNVIHETGLFQGRLGFDKAVIVRQHGCAEFSNLMGVQELRFVDNDISARFDDLRKLLVARI